MVNYMSKAVHARHVWRTVSYSLFAVGSYIGVYAPSLAISEVSNKHLAVAWSVVFAFAVSFAVIGNLRKNLFVEYVALPAMAASFAVYGICLFAASGGGELYRIPGGFFALGIVAFIAARFSELNGQIRGQSDPRTEWPPRG